MASYQVLDAASTSPSDYSDGTEEHGIPNYGFKVKLDHKFPEKWKPLKVLRIHQIFSLIMPFFRFLMLFRRLRREGRKPFINALRPVQHKPIYGVPIGGIGAGTINRGWKGDFSRWSLTPGLYTYKTVEVNQFTVCIRKNNQTVYQKVLSCRKPKNKHLSSAWNWGFPGSQASYTGLYPRAWTVYTIPEHNIKLVCRQVTPIIPGDYKNSSLPVGVFVWDIYNEGDEALEVSIMFTWLNGMARKTDKCGGRWNESFKAEGKKAAVHGVKLHKAHDAMNCTMGISAVEREGVSVSHCISFDPKREAGNLWRDLLEDGALSTDSGASTETDKGKLTAAAVCSSCHVEPSGKNQAEFALVWDMPQINFKLKGYKYKRRYTKFFGSDGQATEDLSLYALENYGDWEEKIEEWQQPVLNDKSLPSWYKSALFNELYFISDGGTVWVESTEEYPNGSKHPHTWSHDLVREYGRFGYLEGHEYRMYNTYDVHFYASFALAMLWPKLELSVQYDYGNLVEHEDQEYFSDLSEGNYAQRKYTGSIPHDIGDPEEEPWVKVNSYLLHDTNYWRDLNSKFVLMVFRDYQFTQDKDFLKHMWPKCKIVMESAKEHDTDDDGVIDNCGKADQTYDVWVVTGASAYCGGLWLAALKCMCEMAEILDHQDALTEYKTILDKGKISYERKLWNGRYYNYDSSDKVYSDSIMADQTAGHWYLGACKLVNRDHHDQDVQNVFPVSNVQSALRTVYEMNVLSMKDGTFGAVNGMRPNGKVDSTSLQGEEIWTGVTYALAANMIQEGMLDEGFQTAFGVYHTCFHRAGLAYQTPEAYMKRKVYRSLGYMRPLSIWAMQWALENQTKDTDGPKENGDTVMH